MASAGALKKQTCCCSAAPDHPAPAGENAAAHSHHMAGRDGDTAGTQAPGDDVRDPVCGMLVNPHKTPHHLQHAGRTYYFCSAGCRDKFATAPEKYLATARAEPPPSVPAGTIYTC